MKTHRQIYEAYINGDTLDDAELLDGVKAFKGAAAALVKLGPTFSLAFKEATNVYWSLEGFALARGIIKKRA